MSATSDTLAKLRQTLEATGVEFIPENGGGADVRLRKGGGVDSGG
ncbi:hypothetical protein [Mesorhizobium tamadayense]|nr:hypothetical protein [Mesorhizobium tamadayense]